MPPAVTIGAADGSRNALAAYPPPDGVLSTGCTGEVLPLETKVAGGNGGICANGF